MRHRRRSLPLLQARRSLARLFGIWRLAPNRLAEDHFAPEAKSAPVRAWLPGRFLRQLTVFIGIPHDFAGDAELVRRALEHILRNALRYAPSVSLVVVSLAKDRAGMTVTIEDEGPGIAQDEISGLFEPFRRGADGGFGLGLSIARRTILAHQGSIEVSNRGAGGLSVAINLPVTRLRNFE